MLGERGPLRAIFGFLLLAGAARTGKLERCMRHFVFRKVLGMPARLAAWRRLGAEIAADVYISAGTAMRHPGNVRVENGTKLAGKNIWLDAWSPIHIGENVLFNDDVMILTAGHFPDSPDFEGYSEPIDIGRYAWLPQRICVLPGANIGPYAVVGTGAVVTAPVRPYAIVAGNPAKEIGSRSQDTNFRYIPSEL